MTSRILDPKFRYHSSESHGTADGLKARLAKILREQQTKAQGQPEPAKVRQINEKKARKA